MSGKRAVLNTPQRGLILLMCLAIGAIIAIITMGQGTSSDKASAQGPVSVSEQAQGAVVTQTDIPRGNVYSDQAGASEAVNKAAPVVAKSTHKSLPHRSQATWQPRPVAHGSKNNKAVVQNNIDGCNRAYGTAAQCIPLRQPGNKAVNCAYLTKHGFFKKPLVIVADPLNLMTKPHVNMSTDARGRMVVSGCSDS